MSYEATDYLVVGAGTVGLAFADTLLSETDAHVTVIDRAPQPGGHWTKAYPFVRLHQPSSFYGVASRPLGGSRIEQHGLNAGLQEMASAAQIVSYFEDLIAEQLLPTGRFRYLPMTEYLEGYRARSLVTGKVIDFDVRRRVVDATYTDTQLPGRCPPYTVGERVSVVTPRDLPDALATDDKLPSRYVVVGGGKTGVDVALWLLTNGVPADRITWVVPRDSWFMDREAAQTGIDFFDAAIGTQANRLEAFAAAPTIPALFAMLEQTGGMSRLDPAVEPEMFHYATVSKGELACLRRIEHVVRLGRVQAINADGMTLQQGAVPIPGDALYVNCSAIGVPRRPARPIFEPGRITLQLVRAPFGGLSVSVIAYVEAHFDDDATRNALCTPIRFPDRAEDFVPAMLGNLVNGYAWSSQPKLRHWLRGNRLDPLSATMAMIDPADTLKAKTLARTRDAAEPAARNLERLVKQVDS